MRPNIKTYKKKIFFKQMSPVQVLHLFQLVTKQLHYFYANQAKYVINILTLNTTKEKNNKKKIIINDIIHFSLNKISTLHLKTLKSFQLKPINYT
jgi:hypothetical protein